jgi:phage tail sheath gpL-like
MGNSTIQRPKTTLNILPAALDISVAEQKILYIGQMTSNGSATGGELIERIENDGSEDSLFGADSMLANMVRNAKKINKVTRMDAIPLEDDGTAVKASGEIAFSGSPTEAGTITVTIGSDEDYKYEIAISEDNDVTDIGDALVTAISNDNHSLVTATNTTGTVEIEANNGGEEGNEIGLRVTGSVAGVTVSVTAMADGATNPDLTNLFDVIDEERYQTIVWPSSYDLDTITDFLDGRWNVTNRVLDGVAIVTKTDSSSNLITLGDGENSQSLVIFGNRSLDDDLWKGPSMLEVNNHVSSQFAALRALRLTEDANLSGYVIGATRGVNDSFGGPALASLPYFNTPFSALPIIPTGKGFTRQQINDMADAGISVFGNNVTKTTIILSDVLTTYKTDAAGNEDVSFKYLNYVDTMSTIREYYVNNLRSRFAQTRLTEGTVVPNRNVANGTVIRAYATQLYSNLASEDFILVQAGEDALNFFRDNLQVNIDLQDGQVNLNMVVPIVTQLREIIGNIQVAFSTEALQ